jgi:hypothetical protein
VSGDAVLRRIIDETVDPERRLGRHVEHDPLSREYAYEAAAAALVAVTHARHGGILNQGNLGSCTGNAAAGAKNTEPVYHSGSTHLIPESGAVDLYSLATRLDGLSDGYYPPTDTGSSGLAVCKAMKQEGMIGSYQHAFSMAAALSALQAGPVITGIDWYEGFDDPDANGVVKIAGQIRGGHEVVARGYEPGASPGDALILLDNSWGTSWGDSGHFYWTVATWQTLLDNQGDVTILTP